MMSSRPAQDSTKGIPGVLHPDGPENCHSAKHEPDLHSKDVFQNTNQTGKNRKEGEGKGRGRGRGTEEGGGGAEEAGRGRPGGGARGEAAAHQEDQGEGQREVAEL